MPIGKRGSRVDISRYTYQNVTQGQRRQKYRLRVGQTRTDGGTDGGRTGRTDGTVRTTDRSTDRPNDRTTERPTRPTDRPTTTTNDDDDDERPNDRSTGPDRNDRTVPYRIVSNRTVPTSSEHRTDRTEQTDDVRTDDRGTVIRTQ